MSCRKWEILILRWHEGELDQETESRLLPHLEICAHCRDLAKKFSEIDSLFLTSQEPSLPHFLNAKIVNTVAEQMRRDSANGVVLRFLRSFASFRPAVAGVVLVLGVGLGVLTGWDLSRSITRNATDVSYDLLSLAGLEGEASGSSLEFIWTDNSGRDVR
jgi:anti-sigma factor RsiW